MCPGPPGMACTALVARLISTCIICVASASTEGTFHPFTGKRPIQPRPDFAFINARQHVAHGPAGNVIQGNTRHGGIGGTDVNVSVIG
jgi:hypothetical protein